MQWMKYSCREKKVSAEAEAYGNIESELNYNVIYHIENMSLDDKKEKKE